MPAAPRPANTRRFELNLPRDLADLLAQGLGPHLRGRSERVIAALDWYFYGPEGPPDDLDRFTPRPRWYREHR